MKESKNIMSVPHKIYYTLPTYRKRPKTFAKKAFPENISESEIPPVKPPRTFASTNVSKTAKPTVFDIFKKTEIQKPKKSNLRRSLSDATVLKPKISCRKVSDEKGYLEGSNEKESRHTKRRHTKKQLSPIIENNPREDYFIKSNSDNKENEPLIEENVKNKPPVRKVSDESNNENAKQLLKKYIDEIDEELFKETGVKVQHTNNRKTEPEVIIIDLDKAEQISRQKNSRTANLGKKFKFLTSCKILEPKEPKPKIETEENINEQLKTISRRSLTPNIKKTIKHSEKQSRQSEMIHSSQKPAEKPPLTKGRAVDTMVKRLSSDSSTSPPPKTSILVTPNISVQHNNNQPFSYTRGISPEKYGNGNDPGSPVIYAQVVCANGATGPSKQTVHTVYTSNVRKHPQHSDSDEGLGYEEHFNKKYSPVEPPTSKAYHNRYVSDLDRDEYFMEADVPLASPKVKTTYFNDYSYKKMFPGLERGRADGMDSRHRESMLESEENFTNTGKSDWSARRDLLESRIHQRLNENKTRLSPPNNLYISEATSKYHRNGSTSPTGFHEKYITETRTDRFGERYNTSYNNQKKYGNRKDDIEYVDGRYGYEPQSIESQFSDYRSSPENRHFESSHNRSNDRYAIKIERQQRLMKERDFHQSNPEIFQPVKESRLEDSYHDSLRRDKRVYKSDRYLDHSESDRKDKFGDSGIENDIKRDSIDNFRPEPKIMYGLKNTESEDEGFASSLLIASERQHTEDASKSKKVKGDYEYDAPYERDEYDFRQHRAEFVPRERSIDDGSHYDPRIDKNFENEARIAVKKIEKKPPKPEKKSGLKKVKQLFMSSHKKNKSEQIMVKEEDLRSRYKEYKGSIEHLDSHIDGKRIREQNMSNEIEFDVDVDRAYKLNWLPKSK
ncbi:hypothetical protein HHI36_000982 [Cryptolaemus montrouzieri]|uniref:Uncharacterized protein n=1 Tax=Cryptolaemus montrouzieri TaxID=559131 RepID=A0ABD2P6Q2_9CUCU